MGWGRSAGKGIVFFMRIEELKIVFVEKLVPECCFALSVFSFQRLWSVLIRQLLFRKNNRSSIDGKKNNTLAGLFDFVGAGHCFIEILNLPIDVVSDGLHSQKQCKDFRFSY